MSKFQKISCNIVEKHLKNSASVTTNPRENFVFLEISEWSCQQICNKFHITTTKDNFIMVHNVIQAIQAEQPTEFRLKSRMHA